jgi:hypothetical protein
MTSLRIKKPPGQSTFPYYSNKKHTKTQTSTEHYTLHILKKRCKTIYLNIVSKLKLIQTNAFSIQPWPNIQNKNKTTNINRTLHFYMFWKTVAKSTYFNTISKINFTYNKCSFHLSLTKHTKKHKGNTDIHRILHFTCFGKHC